MAMSQGNLSFIRIVITWGLLNAFALSVMSLIEWAHCGHAGHARLVGSAAAGLLAVAMATHAIDRALSRWVARAEARVRRGER